MYKTIKNKYTGKIIIYGKTEVIKKKEIESIISLLHKTYHPKEVVVFTTKEDYENNYFNHKISTISEKVKGVCYKNGTIVLVLYNYCNEDGWDTYSTIKEKNKAMTMILYMVLLHELRHMYQFNRRWKYNRDRFEKDANTFAYKFYDRHYKYFKYVYKKRNNITNKIFKWYNNLLFNQWLNHNKMIMK